MSSKRPRSLPSHDAYRVALLVDTSSNWGRGVIRGVAKYSQRNNPWNLFVENRGIDEEIAPPRNWRGDGVIARINSVALANRLAALKIPVVNVSDMYLPMRDRFPRVANAVEVAARTAAQYLIERGFRNFGYLSLRSLEIAARQREAFLEILREYGCHCDVYGIDRHGAAWAPDWNTNIAKLGRWLLSLPKPVAVLTWIGGSEIIHACKAVNLAVPEQVAVLSGTDDLLCEICHITISGVQPALEQIGHEAAALLHRMMQGESAPAVANFVPPLGVITRQSTDTMAISDAPLIRALVFMRENAQRPIQVRDIALAAGVSRRVLERRFMDFLQRTPAAQILMVRMERARELLAKSDKTIPEVADACGFGSPEYFTYVFKREMRVTPLKYRRQVRAR